MQEILTANQLVALSHQAYKRGMVSGPGGNISFRSGNQILITPTGRSLGFINENEIVVLDSAGHYSGNIKPSKEYWMHLNCYHERSECNVVIHVHSTYSVAVSCLRELDRECAMPIFTPGYAIRVGKLPVVPYLRPGSLELAQQVQGIMGVRKSALLANHGFIVVGSTVEEAMGIAEEIEENAKLFMLLQQAGAPLSPQALNELGVS